MKLARLTILLFSLLAMPHIAKSKDIVYEKADSIIYCDYVERFAKLQESPLEELITETALYFLGRPYVASTLEVSEREKLIINLREFDCTTFVENCIALSMTIKSGNTRFSNYCQQLLSLRYREAKIDDYTSRLHYTTDWIYENAERGIIENISARMEGKRIKKEINFMTSHPQSYKHLKGNPQYIEKLREIESAITQRETYTVIPKLSINKIGKNIKNGDIVAFATSIDGIDYSHIGIAYWSDGNLHFIHASSKQKETVVEKRSLSDYCITNKTCTGISILRGAKNNTDDEH